MAIRNLQWYADLETNVRFTSFSEYEHINDYNNWFKLASTMKIEGAEERIIAPINSGASMDGGPKHPEGEIRYSDVAPHSLAVDSDFESRGFRQLKSTMEDSDYGAQAAAQWASDIAQDFAYRPQREVWNAVKNNIESAWDKRPLFGEHQTNPIDASKGVFKNVLQGSASGNYPGAVDLRSTVPIATRLESFSKILAYVSTWKTFDGEHPRNNKLVDVFAPWTMVSSLSQVFNAAVVPQAVNAASAGSANVEAVVASFGLTNGVTYVTELGSAFGGSDTAIYLKFDNRAFNKDIDSLIWVERQEYNLLFFTPKDDDQLSAMDEYKIHARGRHGVAGGYPHLILRVDIA